MLSPQRQISNNNPFIFEVPFFCTNLFSSPAEGDVYESSVLLPGVLFIMQTENPVENVRIKMSDHQPAGQRKCMDIM